MNRICLASAGLAVTVMVSAPLLLIGQRVPTTQAVDRLRESLAHGPKDPTATLPGLSTSCPLDTRGTKIGKAILEAFASDSGPISVTTYTRYREFRKTGDRQPYEKPYFDRRQMLARAVMAAWLSGQADSPDRVNDLVWSICEETNWVVPAHEAVGEIDLFAAETAADLAMTELLLGSRLPDEVRTRLKAEVKRRVIDPYLDHGDRYWWNGGGNNWTGVCAGSIGETLLILEPDAERQAKGLASVVEQLNRFIARAFEEDGASTEGIGYWNYGLSHFVIFAEMLKARTNGEVDLLAGEKIRKIAAYPASIAIGRHAFASFSDNREEGGVLPFLAARLGERAGRSDLFAQATDTPEEGRLPWVLCNLIWYRDQPRTELVLQDAILPKAGVARRVGAVGGKPVIIVAKAGNNAEQHNHNDVGSFVLRVGDTTFLCDPGAGLYDAAYFGSKRYDNVFASSYGHSVPRIGGREQLPGAKYRGTLQAADDGVVRIEFHEAYGIPEMTGLLRTIRVEKDGAVTLADEFSFTGAGLEAEEAFLTWHDVRVQGNVARVVADDGQLEIKADSGVFAAERLEEACKANKKKGVLTRLTVKYPAASSVRAHFTMSYKAGR